MSLNHKMRYLNPYDMHKLLINEYVLKYPGDTRKFERDTFRDRRDSDVIKENHKFLWDENHLADTWELQFAKKYYDKLFKEYCIGDLTLYKENKIALRWRVEKEVIIGKGQFICGNKRCVETEDLRTWEVNFAYREENQKKNALVKIRLCPDCSKKLNYHSKKREIKRLKNTHKPKTMLTKGNKEGTSTSETISTGDKSDSESQKPDETKPNTSKEAESLWDSHKPIEVKSREEEMEEYLNDLIL